MSSSSLLAEEKTTAWQAVLQRYALNGASVVFLYNRLFSGVHSMERDAEGRFMTECLEHVVEYYL